MKNHTLLEHWLSHTTTQWDIFHPLHASERHVVRGKLCRERWMTKDGGGGFYFILFQSDCTASIRLHSRLPALERLIVTVWKIPVITPVEYVLHMY